MKPFVYCHRLSPSLALGLLLVSGCTSCLTPRGTTAWRWEAPDVFTPRRTSPPAPGTSATSEPGSTPGGGAGSVSPPPSPQDARDDAPRTPAGQPPAGPDVTIRQRLDAPAPGPQLPRSEGPAAGAADGLSLKVHAPETARLGETVRFEVTIANLTGRGLADVELTCDFDPGLAFPGGTEQSLAQSVGGLAPGAVRTAPLVLELIEPGRHRATFTLTAPGGKPVSQTVQVQSLPPTVEVALVGPSERRVGQRAEYVLTVLNHDARDLPATQVSLVYPSVLTAREASAGVQRGEGRLSWDLGTLSAQERVQIQVEFECVAAATPAVIEVRLESPAAAVAARSRLTIAPAQPLRLELRDSDDPVSVGDHFHYELDLRNSAAAAVSDWRLHLVPSEGLELGQAMLVDPASTRPLNQRFVEGAWQVEGLPPLTSEAPLSMRIPARAVREGTAALEVRLMGPAGETVSTREPTVVNPPSADLNARRAPGGATN